MLMLPDAGSRVARMMGPRWWSVIPTHVQYFTRKSLTRLLGDHGFELRHLGTTPKAFTVRLLPRANRGLLAAALARAGGRGGRGGRRGPDLGA